MGTQFGLPMKPSFICLQDEANEVTLDGSRPSRSSNRFLTLAFAVVEILLHIPKFVMARRGSEVQTI